MDLNPFLLQAQAGGKHERRDSELESTFVYKLRTGSKTMNILCNGLGCREKGMEEPETFTYALMAIFVCCYFSNKEFLVKEKNFNI